MYVYQRKINKKRLYLVVSVCMLMVVSFMGVFWQLNKPTSKVAPVVSEKEDLVIALPDKEKARLPFDVEASVVIEYFDGSDHEVADYTNVNGVYRPNQGIDYAFNAEAFDVLSMLSGNVSEVKQDSLFGNSITITNKNMAITYQSLGDIKWKKGDTIKQGEVISTAFTNTYNASIGNHVHIVVSKDGKVIDPKTIIGKTISEMK